MRKKDEARYEAEISKEGSINITSNGFVLRGFGEPPCLGDLNVTAKAEEVFIYYSFEVPKHSPVIKEIRWTKDTINLDLSNARYCGGGLNDKCITISSPGEEDEGVYTCTVFNAAGSVSKQVKIDKPSAEMHGPSSKTVIWGSDTSLNCCVSGYPYPDEVEWQKSIDGTTFIPLNHWTDNSSVRSEDPSSQSLLLENVTLDHQQYYQVSVSNVFGTRTSNSVFLQVTGNKPYISEGMCTLQGRSVKLKFDVILYDESPSLNDVYWTKNVVIEGKDVDKRISSTKCEMDTNDLSLTITEVDKYDAGSYRLTAVNPVGESISESIVLGDPDVFLEKYKETEDGGLCFTMTIKSVPVPNNVLWKKKEK